MATITLYKTGLTRSKNAAIDNIELFLENKPHGTITDVQYQKLALEMRIKLNLPASFANVGRFDYAAISNNDQTGVRYFFLDRPEILSAGTVAFNMHMDTINSFKDVPFTRRTYIEREHRSRFAGSKYLSGDKYLLVRKIDETNEGFNPVKYRISNIQLSQDTDWTLFYKSLTDVNEDSTNAIRMICQPSDGMLAELRSSVITLDPSKSYALFMGRFSSSSSPRQGANIASDTLVLMDDSGHEKTISFSGFPYKKESLTGFWGIKIICTASKWYKAFYYGKDITPDFSLDYSVGFIPTKIKINAAKYYTANTPTANNATPLTENNGPAVTDIYLKPSKSIDRTSSNLAKIIALPYAPFDVEMQENVLVIPDGFAVNSDGELYTDDPFINMEAQAGYISLGEMRAEVFVSSLNGNAARNDYLESKMLSSEFYTKSLSYDSFIRDIALERVTIPSADYPLIVPVVFKVTNTVNSKFAFKIDFDETDIVYNKIMDFEEYLVIERNNEETIYNNNFLNYIRVGYNYDKKQNTLSMITNIAGGVGQIAGNVARGAISGNYAGAVIGAAGAAINTIAGAISQQNAFEHKLADIRAQSFSVSGSNDIDLLKWYSNNKAYSEVYVVSEKMRNHLLDLFYYYGYAVRSYGVPNVSSRYWFNYIQCAADFDTSAYGIEENILENIRQRYAEGVTHYHEHSGQWDLAQTKENWESWPIE